MAFRTIYILGLLVWGLSSCQLETPIFVLKQPESTGITFNNKIATSDTFNALFFEYIYNGGGVAAADFNNDGLTDLFFTGNQVSSELYLNRGDLQFEAVTDLAGVQTDRWCTGVSVVDINGDGKKDIYVSVAGFQLPAQEMENLLFINQGWDEQGIPSFREEAADYGLNDDGYSTQAAFLDYDLDGDLDMYLLTNAMESFSRNNIRPKRVNGEATSTDRLFQNNGDGSFTNVSRTTGILIEGYGLGVKIADINLDGWPDIYAANDFQSNDLLWINQRDGSFRNEIGAYLKHQTHNGMGVDIADFNNDGLPDITVLDMLPEDNYRQKMMIPYISQEKFRLKQQEGYEDQYMRNTVQLHQGFSTLGTAQFSEIGFLTGMASTDWSWSVLYADFDNDGWKDAYITNGYRKDVTNLDYINYSGLNQIFGTVEARREKAVEDLDEAPDVEVSNYLFRNKKALQFENITRTGGTDQASFSNGAVYADLDNDGDLELVVNNIDAPAFVYENRSQDRSQKNHFIQLVLQEQEAHITSHHAKVRLYSPAGLQYQEFSPFAGYKSTLTDVLHFGLGQETQIDSLVIDWADGNHQIVPAPVIDQRINITYQQSSRLSREAITTSPISFQEVTERNGISFIHGESQASDLRTQRTKIHDHAKLGPAVAIGDLNGDGLEDIFIGGNLNQSGALYLQTPNSTFTFQSFPLDSTAQDVAAALFDLDQDGDLDLYVASGQDASGAAQEDRLYLNDGHGNFSPSSKKLPLMTSTHTCLKPADFDQDGDIDLFVGGRVVPGAYPSIPRSYLLENEAGQLIDKTPDALKKIGMVTDAEWVSAKDTDVFPNLLIVGEWMSPQLLTNRQGQLELTSLSIQEASSGWWTHLRATDFDQDGDMDYLLGNWGWNSKLRASEQEPLRLYAADFDQNGTIDPLLSCYIQGQEYIMHERDLLIAQIPGMKKRFPNYEKYAQAGLKQTLSTKDIESARVLESEVLASSLLINDGKENFSLKSLPEAFQFSPMMGSLVLDLNKDNQLDLITAGNFQATETTQIGWYDSSYGQIAYQDAEGNWETASALALGLKLDGDVRDLRALSLADGQMLLLVARYNGPLTAYKWQTTHLQELSQTN